MSDLYAQYGEPVHQLTLWVTREDRGLLKLVAARLGRSRDAAFQYAIRRAATELGITPNELSNEGAGRIDTEPHARRQTAPAEPIPEPRPRDAADVLADIYGLILNWPTPEERAAAASGADTLDGEGGTEEGRDTEAEERE
jgi:hypothetical protein